MFKLHLKGRPVSMDLDIDNLAERTEFYVASDISFLVNEASRNALKGRITIESNPPRISH